MKNKLATEMSCDINLNNYQAMIFDLDGTLVDSSQAIIEVLTTWCDIHKIPLDVVLRRCHGARIVDFLPDIAPHLDIKKEVKYLSDLEAVTKTGLVEISGAKCFLAQLDAQDLKWAIATSGTRAVAELRLTSCGLTVPDIFVTSELVKNGKPQPEPFLLAADKLAVNPQHCLAFEDSDTGIKSAIEAGCDVVVIGQASTIVHKRIVARVNDYHAFILSKELMEIT
ncbi:MAG: HAD-IA family hydrolase [Colwellia sp.]|nr:HAD-IA family hydrolase [Colwellia sp.]